MALQALILDCGNVLSQPGDERSFVDDRIENLTAAAGMGMRTLHFDGEDAVSRLVCSVRSLSA